MIEGKKLILLRKIKYSENFVLETKAQKNWIWNTMTQIIMEIKRQL